MPVIERCINHISGSFGGIVGVYQKHEFTIEKADALARWATHVEGLVADRHQRRHHEEASAAARQAATAPKSPKRLPKFIPIPASLPGPAGKSQRKPKHE